MARGVAGSGCDIGYLFAVTKGRHYGPRKGSKQLPRATLQQSICTEMATNHAEGVGTDENEDEDAMDELY